MQRENTFQSKLISDIGTLFPRSLILKNDTSYIQGIPDLLILNGNRWAMLECKRSQHASHQPNQDYYVELLNEMSYAQFVYPENKEVVLRDIQTILQY